MHRCHEPTRACTQYRARCLPCHRVDAVSKCLIHRVVHVRSWLLSHANILSCVNTSILSEAPQTHMWLIKRPQLYQSRLTPTPPGTGICRPQAITYRSTFTLWFVFGPGFGTCVRIGGSQNGDPSTVSPRTLLETQSLCGHRHGLAAKTHWLTKSASP